MMDDRNSARGQPSRPRIGLLRLIGIGQAPAHAGALLELKVERSRMALGIERAWPRLWLPLALVVAFLIVSLAGLWPALAPLAHRVVLAAFGLLLLASLIPVARTPWPSREEALRRLERQSGLVHRPATAYEDRLAAQIRDPQSERIWAVHRARVAALVARLGVRMPAPRVEPHDPFALRELLLLALVLGLVVAGDASRDRILSAFRLSADAGGPAVRIDAWIAPPAYTGKLPAMLASGPEQAESDRGEARLIETPEGTQLVVRAVGPGHLDFKVRLIGADQSVEEIPRLPGADPKSDVSEWKAALTAPVTVRVLAGSTERYSWQFSVTDDLPPTIELTRPPTSSPRGAMSLTFRASDDYGVQSAEAAFALADPKLKIETITGPDGKVIGPLAEPPVVALKLGKPGKDKSKDTRAPLDLAAHPYAGLKVALTLSAKDHAGQVGKSRVHEMLMPARKFAKPLARALVEQRRRLALQPARFGEVLRALDALTLAPERFFAQDMPVYLGIRSVYWRLSDAPSEASFRSAVDQLWQIALRVEDGDLSDAERALKEAQDRLAQALQDGASDEEIQRLMNELRQAMNEFLKALTAQAQQNRDARGEQRRADRTLSQRDLEQMLKEIEELAKSGATDQAQQMLSQLRDLLDRLQAGRQAGEGQAGQQMMQSMEEFGNLITGQRRLMDDTFGQQQGSRRPGAGQRGQKGKGKGERQSGQGEGEESGSGDDREFGADELGRRQGELRRQLGELMQQLQGLSEDAEQRLGNAQRAMEDAEGSLEEGDLDSAVRQQGKALEDLREGAQAMTEQMMKQGQGQADAESPGGSRDPAGRLRHGADEMLDGELGNKDLKDGTVRANEILRELRRRLGEATRPGYELDYLERLLKRQ